MSPPQVWVTPSGERFRKTQITAYVPVDLIEWVQEHTGASERQAMKRIKRTYFSHQAALLTEMNFVVSSRGNLILDDMSEGYADEPFYLSQDAGAVAWLDDDGEPHDLQNDQIRLVL